MWVCIEIDLDNVEVWFQVDKILCEELGLTHVIWGIDSKKKNTPCKLPSNLFYAHIKMSEKELIAEICRVLKPLCIGYNIIAMKDSWSHEILPTPKEACSLLAEDSDISSREE